MVIYWIVDRTIHKMKHEVCMHDDRQCQLFFIAEKSRLLQKKHVTRVSLDVHSFCWVISMSRFSSEHRSTCDPRRGAWQRCRRSSTAPVVPGTPRSSEVVPPAPRRSPGGSHFLLRVALERLEKKLWTKITKGWGKRWFMHFEEKFCQGHFWNNTMLSAKDPLNESTSCLGGRLLSVTAK